jgi:hypothetical protein
MLIFSTPDGEVEVASPARPPWLRKSPGRHYSPLFCLEQRSSIKELEEGKIWCTLDVQK